MVDIALRMDIHGRILTLALNWNEILGSEGIQGIYFLKPRDMIKGMPGYQFTIFTWLA